MDLNQIPCVGDIVDYFTHCYLRSPAIVVDVLPMKDNENGRPYLKLNIWGPNGVMYRQNNVAPVLPHTTPSSKYLKGRWAFRQEFPVAQPKKPEEELFGSQSNRFVGKLAL